MITPLENGVNQKGMLRKVVQKNPSSLALIPDNYSTLQ